VKEVNRKLAFALGLVLGASLAKLLRRGPREGDAGVDPRARELRRRLAETRAGPDAGAEPDQARPPVADEPSVGAGPQDIEGLRRRVHEEGRAATEHMRRSGEERPNGGRDT
jgi:hypothetical protein